MTADKQDESLHAAFQAWAASEKPEWPDLKLRTDRTQDGDYVYGEVEIAWLAYRAATMRAAEEVRSLRDLLQRFPGCGLMSEIVPWVSEVRAALTASAAGKGGER